MPRVRFNAINVILVLCGLGLLAAGLYVGHRLQQRRVAQGMRDQIDAAIAAGDATAAIEGLERYMAIRPADNGRLAQMAKLLVQRVFTGEADERQAALARDVIRAAVARMPEDDGLRESWAQILLASGDPDAALSHAETLWAKQAGATGDRESRDRIGFLLAQSAMAAREGTRAEETLRDLIDSRAAGDPPAPRDAFAMLALLLAQGRHEPRAAEDVLDKLVAAWPEDPEAWKLLGSWQHQAGKLEEAAESAERARRLAPEDPGAALLEATVALTRGDRERAAAILAGPLADAPLSERIVVLRADVAFSKGDVEGTMDVLRRGIEAFPDNRNILSQALAVATNAGSIDDLRALLPVARERLGDEAPAVVYAEAKVAMADQRWVAALKSWEKARELLAEDPTVVKRIDLAMARCHAMLDQPDQAAEARRRATDDDPRSIEALAYEAQSLEETGRPAEALAILERIATTIPLADLPSRPGIWQPLFRLRLIDVLRRPEDERDWTKVDSLLQAIERSSLVPEGTREKYRIDVLRVKGRVDEALAAGEAAFASRPDDPEAAERLLQLLALSGREAEALERATTWEPEVRDALVVLAAEAAIAVGLPAARSDAWMAEVERGLATLEGTQHLALKRRVMLSEAIRGRTSSAERIGREIVASSPDDLPVRQLLLDLAIERGDADAVIPQAAEIERLAGADTAVGKVARSAALVLGSIADLGGGVIEPEELPEAIDLAGELLDEAAEERPTWPDVERQRALVAEVRGDRAAAIGRLRRAIRAGEEVPWSRRRLARLLVQTRRFDEAIPVLASLGDGGGPIVERIRAEFAESEGQGAAALAIGAAATPADCRDVDQLAWYARLLARQGRVEEAVATCRRAIALAPELHVSWLVLLSILVDAGQPDQVAALEREALGTLRGKQAERFELAAARVKGGDVTIEARLRQAVESRPDDASAGLRLAEYLESRGEVREARQQLERVAGLPGDSADPGRRTARRRLALNLGQRPGQSDLREALRLVSPDGSDTAPNADDTSIAASILSQRGDPASWRRAIAQYDAVEALRPLSVEERLQRARTRARLGGRQRVLAREEMAKIAASPEGSVAVLAMLVEIAIDDGDPAETERWLARLRLAAPNAPGTALLEARAARAAGDDEAAARAVARLVPDRPLTRENAASMILAASMAEKAGSPERAERVFREAAGSSDEDRLRWAGYLGRRGRTAEALDELEKVRATVSPARFMDQLVEIVEHADQAGVQEQFTRVDELRQVILRENPGAADLKIKAATLADFAGRCDMAVATYRELLAESGLTPTQRAIASGNLAYDLAEAETAAEAAKLVDRAIEELGPIPSLLDTRAMIRLAQGDTAAALEDMTDALLLPSAGRHLHLAAIQVEAGDLSAARAAFAKAVEEGLDARRLSDADRRRREAVEAALADDR